MLSTYLFLLLVISIFISGCNATVTDFSKCAQNFVDVNPLNTSYLDSQGIPALYTGPLTGFNGNSSVRPITVTEQACGDYCGWTPQYNDALAAFQVLTTWVLPVLGLMGQLPYESLSRNKWRKNAEAFVNWLGAPAAALTTTLWNILTIGECHQIPTIFVGDRSQESIIKDALYVLSCINQYEYPRRPPGKSPEPHTYRRRDEALLRGILFAYIPHIPNPLRAKLEDMTQLLAFHLRLQRRRGVYPIYIGILWFGVAFGLSIALAFGDLGDNSTAHSLALGLLLCWVPVVVFASVVDRNPTSSTHCSEMIKRWLFNVDRLFRDEELWRGPEVGWTQEQVLNAGTQLEPFNIGEFLGQGRKLRYCGVTDTVLKRITQTESIARRGYMKLPQITTAAADAPANVPGTEAITFDDFQKALIRRPLKWYLVWLVSQAMVTTCFGMAFMVSFNTPTVGLGCRSLLYLVWFLLTLPSSISLLFQQEPPEFLRTLMMVPSALSVLTIFAIMLAQTINGFNSCTCKASAFGINGTTGYAGYVDFENAVFYRDHYNVRQWWGVATGIGGTMLVGSLAWLARMWQRSSGLWKVTEDRLAAIRNDIPLDMLR